MRTSARSFWASMTWRSRSASTRKASAGRSRTTTRSQCFSSRTGGPSWASTGARASRRTHGRGTSCDEGARQGAEVGREQRGGRKRRAREDRRNGGLGSRHGQAGPRDRQSQRAGPLAETLVRDARVLQGREGRLLLPRRAEVQEQVRDVWLQRRGESRRRRAVAGRLRAEGVDRRHRGTHRRAREESGELRTGRRAANRPRREPRGSNEAVTFGPKVVSSRR